MKSDAFALDTVGAKGYNKDTEIKGGMDVRSYDTKAKSALSEYLRTNSDKQYTAEELTQIMNGVAGKSTVYRLLFKLCEDGEIRRLPREGERGAFYQAIPDAKCLGHLHMKCTQCGFLVHLGEAQSRRIFAIALESGFSVDTKMTMLYGLCEKCQKKGR